MGCIYYMYIIITDCIIMCICTSMMLIKSFLLNTNYVQKRYYTRRKKKLFLHKCIFSLPILTAIQFFRGSCGLEMSVVLLCDRFFNNTTKLPIWEKKGINTVSKSSNVLKLGECLIFLKVAVARGLSLMK